MCVSVCVCLPACLRTGAPHSSPHRHITRMRHFSSFYDDKEPTIAILLHQPPRLSTTTTITTTTYLTTYTHRHTHHTKHYLPTYLPTYQPTCVYVYMCVFLSLGTTTATTYLSIFVKK